MNSQSAAGFDFFVAGLPDFDFFGGPFLAAFFIARSTAPPTPASVTPLRKAFLTSFSIAFKAFSVFFLAIFRFSGQRNASVIKYCTGIHPPLLPLLSRAEARHPAQAPLGLTEHRSQRFPFEVGTPQPPGHRRCLKGRIP